jgi:hypothetical protein
MISAPLSSKFCLGHGPSTRRVGGEFNRAGADPFANRLAVSLPSAA